MSTHLTEIEADYRRDRIAEPFHIPHGAAGARRAATWSGIGRAGVGAASDARRLSR